MQKKEKETNSTPDVPTKAYFFIKGRYLLCSGFPLCLKAKYSMQSYIEYVGKSEWQSMGKLQLEMKWLRSTKWGNKQSYFGFLPPKTNPLLLWLRYDP